MCIDTVPGRHTADVSKYSLPVDLLTSLTRSPLTIPPKTIISIPTTTAVCPCVEFSSAVVQFYVGVMHGVVPEYHAILCRMGSW